MRPIGRWWTNLVESVEQLGNQRTTGAGSAQRPHETELVQVANEAIGGVCAEGQRVAPEVPLESDDRGRGHAGPDHGEGGLSARETGVEEGQAGDHDQHHGRGHDDVGLVARLVPLVEVLGFCERTVSVRTDQLARAARRRTRITAEVGVGAVEGRGRADPRVRHDGLRAQEGWVGRSVRWSAGAGEVEVRKLRMLLWICGLERGRGGILTRWPRTTRLCRRIVKTSKYPRVRIAVCLSPLVAPRCGKLDERRRAPRGVWPGGFDQRSGARGSLNIGQPGIAASGCRREQLRLRFWAPLRRLLATSATASRRSLAPPPRCSRAVRTALLRPPSSVRRRRRRGGRSYRCCRPARGAGAESAWHGMADGRPAAAPLSLATQMICHRLMQAATTLASDHRGPCLLRPSALPDRRQERACPQPRDKPSRPITARRSATPNRSLRNSIRERPFCSGAATTRRVLAAGPLRASACLSAALPSAWNASRCSQRPGRAAKFVYKYLLSAPRAYRLRAAHHPCCPSDSPRSPRGHYTRRAGPRRDRRETA